MSKDNFNNDLSSLSPEEIDKKFLEELRKVIAHPLTPEWFKERIEKKILESRR